MTRRRTPSHNKPPLDMVKVYFSIDYELDQRIRRLAGKQGIPLTRYLCQVVEEHLKQHEKPTRADLGFPVL